MSSNLYLTSERNALIVIALLKKYGIRKVIASPGTTNKVFVWSIQQDPFFEIYSSVDERSAAYLACGMAAESGEPVVISCTGATASRNYLSGLTEAYYRKLPVIAITSHQGIDRLGNLRPQNIDRRQTQFDIAMVHVDAPIIKDARDENFCINQVNKALHYLSRNGGGPVHINLFTNYSQDFSVEQLPNPKRIFHYTVFDKLPVFPHAQHVVVCVGSHKKFTEDETAALDQFCASHNAIVYCDHTSGYHGVYKAQMALVFCQENYVSQNKQIDLLIHIGEMSGDYCFYKANINKVWRVSEDGEIRDTYGKIDSVFEMPEQAFFEYYSKDGANQHSYLDSCLKEYESLFEQIPDLPFSNLWTARQLHDRLPIGASLHLGILNSLRSWNFFEIDNSIDAYCNVGGFGIDGGLSALIGASLVNPNRLYFGVFGDLAFFYDMNVLGNRHVGKNVRIMLINNGRGTEFRNYSHDCHIFGEAADPFMAAAGHFGHQSHTLIKHYAQDLGYDYISASNKEEFLSEMDTFCSESIDKSIIFEVFTDSAEESNALQTMLTYQYDAKFVLKRKIRQRAQNFKREIKRTLLGVFK